MRNLSGYWVCIGGLATPDRLSTIGYGKKYPVAYESAPREIYSKAAKANMRVLFEIVV